MKKENKVKLVISAEGDLNNKDDFKINLVAEGRGLDLSFVLAVIMKRKDWLKKVVEQALEIYEEY